MFNKKIILLLLFFIISLALIIQNEKWFAENKKKNVFAIKIEKCNPQIKECVTVTDEFKLGILLDENISYLKPFNVLVWSESKNDIHIESMQIDFKMKNMNMGVNRFMFKEIESKNKKHKWQGKVILPICVTGRADWVSELEVVTKKRKYIFSFPVSVIRSVN